MRALVVGLLCSLAPAVVSATTFRNPFAQSQCAWAGGCYVTAYFDLNRTVGPVKDWGCGTKTYDNHTGVDMGVGGFTGMNQGRDVYAAADGTVIGAHDGEFDQCTSGACGAANYVWIKHADGKVSLYYHLRKNTVAVAVGQTVTCGQKIGQVGSSGYSTGPHLHFQVNSAAGNANSFDDPFAGINASCGGPYSWWVAQGGYNSLPGYQCEPKPLPDMVVLDVAFTPANPRAGDAVQLSATVKNAGAAITGADVGIGFFVDGKQLGWAIRGPMAAGATDTLQANVTWPAVAGAHTFEAWVDDINRFPEENEANNRSTKSVTVLALPELSVTEAHATPAAPVEGEPVSFSAVVTNSGGPTGAGAVLRLVLDQEPPVEVAVPALAEGATATLAFEAPWIATAGDHVVTLVVNGDGAVKEQDGANNALQLPLPVLYADADADGARRDVDCDDANPAVNPAAQEQCDGVDNDCDGELDDEVACAAPPEPVTSPEAEPAPGDAEEPGLPAVAGSSGCSAAGPGVLGGLLPWVLAMLALHLRARSSRRLR